MILIALGANLPTERFGPPERGLEAALAVLQAGGVAVRRRSRWYRSRPVPASDQPWFVNGVAAVETALAPRALLGRLLALERGFGRRRGLPNAARVLDLDLLAYDRREVGAAGAGGLILPHPRLHQRAFVLVPLAEIAPAWRHPRLGLTARQMLGRLGDAGTVLPLAPESAA